MDCSLCNNDSARMALLCWRQSRLPRWPRRNAAAPSQKRSQTGSSSSLNPAVGSTTSTRARCVNSVLSFCLLFVSVLQSTCFVCPRDPACRILPPCDICPSAEPGPPTGRHSFRICLFWTCVCAQFWCILWHRVRVSTRAICPWVLLVLHLEPRTSRGTRIQMRTILKTRSRTRCDFHCFSLFFTVFHCFSLFFTVFPSSFRGRLLL